MKTLKPNLLLILCCLWFGSEPIAANAQIARDKCKFLGNVIGRSLSSDFDKYWNQVTPENSGKWGSVERTRDSMSWTALDNAYSHARKMNVPFKQHTLVWGQQQPAWMDTLSSSNQKEEVEQWIKAYCERYPDTDYIDVVNEPLHAIPSYAEALGGKGTTGWDWVVWSFEKAREYCPNSSLALNDYNILKSDSATQVYLGIVNILKERQLIDIVGSRVTFSRQPLSKRSKTMLTCLPALAYRYTFLNTM